MNLYSEEVNKIKSIKSIKELLQMLQYWEEEAVEEEHFNIIRHIKDKIDNIRFKRGTIKSKIEKKMKIT